MASRHVIELMVIRARAAADKLYAEKQREREARAKAKAKLKARAG